MKSYIYSGDGFILGFGYDGDEGKSKVNSPRTDVRNIYILVGIKRGEKRIIKTSSNSDEIGQAWANWIKLNKYDELKILTREVEI